MPPRRQVLLRVAATAAALATALAGCGNSGTASRVEVDPGVTMHATVAQAATQTGATSTASPEVAWVRSAILADGAIASYPDKQRIDPYLASYAAIGLAESGDPAGARAAARWVRWYASHMDANGYMHDHAVLNGAAVDLGTFDSTDAYAGMFLVALERSIATGVDPTLARDLRPAVARAVAAIRSTQDADGLTWAKPGWRVKYLMDQAESWAGLDAATRLAAASGDPATATTARRARDRLAAGVAGLWSPSAGGYVWAVHDDSTRVRPNWRTFYPDATSQLWPAAFGMPGGHGAEATGRFLQEHPSWARPRDTMPFGLRGWWPVAGWAMARSGRLSQAREGLAALDTAAAARREWPYTTASAGQIVSLRRLAAVR